MNINNNTSKTLWIGEIDSWMEENSLAEAFSNYGNQINKNKAIVKNLKIIRDKLSQTNQGYGFVEFDSSEEASYVLETCNGNLIPNSNKIFKLNWASFSAGKIQALLGKTSNIQEQSVKKI